MIYNEIGKVISNEEISEGMCRDHHAPGVVHRLAKLGCFVHSCHIPVHAEHQNVSHIGVHFQRSNNRKSGIFERLVELRLLPAATVFG